MNIFKFTTLTTTFAASFISLGAMAQATSLLQPMGATSVANAAIVPNAPCPPPGPGMQPMSCESQIAEESMTSVKNNQRVQIRLGRISQLGSGAQPVPPIDRAKSKIRLSLDLSTEDNITPKGGEVKSMALTFIPAKAKTPVSGQTIGKLDSQALVCALSVESSGTNGPSSTSCAVNRLSLVFTPTFISRITSLESDCGATPVRPPSSKTGNPVSVSPTPACPAPPSIAYQEDLLSLPEGSYQVVVKYDDGSKKTLMFNESDTATAVAISPTPSHPSNPSNPPTPLPNPAEPAPLPPPSSSSR